MRLSAGPLQTGSQKRAETGETAAVWADTTRPDSMGQDS
jgi:hypothetical protein